MPQLFKRWIMQSNKRNHYPLDKCQQKIYTTALKQRKKIDNFGLLNCSLVSKCQ